MVRRGIDPLDDKREEHRRSIDLAFSAYVDLFEDQYLKKRWKDWRQGSGLLRREAVPILARKPLPKIRRADLNPVFDRMENRPASQRLLFATLRKLFRWAMGRGDIDRSPLEAAEAPSGVAPHDRVLTDHELASLWAATEQLSHQFRCLYRLLTLTGQRRDEVGGLTWDELDRNASMWTLPGSRAKNGETHLIPLSDLAIEVLDQMADGEAWPPVGSFSPRMARLPSLGFQKRNWRSTRQCSRSNEGSLCKVGPAFQTN